VNGSSAKRRLLLEEIAFGEESSTSDRLRALELLRDAPEERFAQALAQYDLDDPKERAALTKPIRMSPQSFARALREYQAKGGDPSRLLRYMDPDDLERRLEREAETRAAKLADPARIDELVRERAQEIAREMWRSLGPDEASDGL
jgi:hypothetical protein